MEVKDRVSPAGLQTSRAETREIQDARSFHMRFSNRRERMLKIIFMMGGGFRREGTYFIPVADSCWCVAEANTIL